MQLNAGEVNLGQPLIRGQLPPLASNYDTINYVLPQNDEPDNIQDPHNDALNPPTYLTFHRPQYFHLLCLRP